MQVYTPGVTPIRWSVNPNRVGAEYKHITDSALFIAPLWEGGGNPQDIITKQLASTFEADWIHTQSGRTMELTPTTASAVLWDFNPMYLEALKSMWFHCLITVDTVSTTNPQYFSVLSQGTGETQAENVLYWMRLNDSAGNLKYIHEYGSGSNELKDIPNLFVVNERFTFGFSRDDGAKQVRFFKNGALFDTFNYTNSPAVGTGKPKVSAGCQVSVTDKHFDGKYEILAFGAGPLGDRDFAALHRDAFGLIRPALPRGIKPAAAAAADGVVPQIASYRWRRVAA